MKSRKMNKLSFLWYLCGYRIEESREWRRVPTSTRISKSVPARIVPVGRLGVCMESLGQKCGAMIESHHAFQWWSLCEPGPERNVSQTLGPYTQALFLASFCLSLFSVLPSSHPTSQNSFSFKNSVKQRIFKPSIKICHVSTRQAPLGYHTPLHQNSLS